jgi:methylenetetrahydrofolate dehydrogenase (NADP+)/methenyltetrahydrofolate cyclohydrolase
MGVIVDGKQLALQVQNELKPFFSEHSASLAVFVMAPDFATQKFISIKKKVAAELGVTVHEYPLSPHTTDDELIKSINDVCLKCTGVIVQLPLGKRINIERVRGAIPPLCDVDVLSNTAFEKFLSENTFPMPPVVGALVTILSHHNISIEKKHVVVIGQGRLVGLPAAQWFSHKGAQVTTLSKDSIDIAHYTQDADIIVLGAGVPGLLTPDMFSEGVVILDAGTSEVNGKLKGDADPRCAEKAGLFTPVPGGIGPITVAMIFKNLAVLLARQQEQL